MESRFPPESISVSSPTTAIAYVFLAIYGIHLALAYFDVPLLSLHEFLWNAVVYCIPAPLLLDSTRRRELRAKAMLPQMHAAKSEALRQALGYGRNAILQQLPSASEPKTGSNSDGWSGVPGATPTTVTSVAPAGLGNWDNSCYQNSVLQALTALDTLPLWLDSAQDQCKEKAATTNGALQEMVAKLRDPTSNGKYLWTPAKLKNMSSWQQQDAQEYFSKIMDDLDKEAAKNLVSQRASPGLESLPRASKGFPERDDKTSDDPRQERVQRNPLEGLIAQRVACTSCGFSEGYSMIPFNCLTVPLGSSMEYDLSQCLDEYTKREAIEGVECRRCTLLSASEKIQAMAVPRSVQSNASQVNAANKVLDLPPEVRAQVAQRLQAIQAALSQDDYSDKTLKQVCQIPTKGYVSSTKTREAMVGRAPETLVVHINRSVFDEMTGVQRKNHARVRYPLVLDLTPWTLSMDNGTAHYRLRAVVTHYGRHENGHYICYRQHPSVDVDVDGKASLQWWRLSDEDVSSATEADVLDQGGVFMLFYERQPEYVATEITVSDARDVAATQQINTGVSRLEELDDLSVPLSVPVESYPRVSSSRQSVTSDSDTDLDMGHDDPSSSTPSESKRPQAPIMRTAPPTDVKHDFPIGRSMMSV